jgi:hypothetical protein
MGAVVSVWFGMPNKMAEFYLILNCIGPMKLPNNSISVDLLWGIGLRSMPSRVFLFRMMREYDQSRY